MKELIKTLTRADFVRENMEEYWKDYSTKRKLDIQIISYSKNEICVKLVDYDVEVVIPEWWVKKT